MIIKRILVPLDFGETSTYVLDFARVLADASGASLHLLHVINGSLLSAAMLNAQREQACQHLQELATRLDHQTHPVTTSCEIGTPAEAIVRFADDHDVNVIVMGTHCHGPTFSMTVGSIAESVLGLARCAVVAVKRPECLGRRSASDPLVIATPFVAA